MCGGPQWKREAIQDHKFDFIDVREFHSTEFGTRAKYFLLYCIVLKSFLVYMSDIFTAITMLSTNDWTNQIQKSCPKDSDNGCIVIPFQVAKWLFVGCIIFSFLLVRINIKQTISQCQPDNQWANGQVGYEARKSKKIIASRDISYAFTNVMASNYYSLRSYDHFCLFSQISSSTKKKDDFAFFVFFTFKSWKRLLLADGPRQSINALTLYSFYLSKLNDGPVLKLSKYSDNFITSTLLVVMLFTVLVFVLSMLLLIAAGICYVPLLCYIRGNLKEYCCHKVDKRIAELIKRKNKQRLAKQAALAKKEAAGDFSHLKDKQGRINILPQPTLPSVSLDDDDSDMRQQRSQYAPSTYKSDYASSVYPNYPPAMPEYQPYSHVQPQGAYAAYGRSVGTLPQEEAYDRFDTESDYGSTFNLAVGAAPMAQSHQRGYSNSSSNILSQHPPPSSGLTPTSDAYGGYVRDDNAGHYDSHRGYNGGRSPGYFSGYTS